MRPAVLLRTVANIARESARGGMFTLQLLRGTVKTLRMISQWQVRARAVKRMTTFVAADQSFVEIASRIPGGPTWGKYRSQLRLARVGSSKEKPVYAVYAQPKALANRDIDPARSVMYIRPKKNFLGKIRKEVLVLAKYSPWTAETLPFSPKKNEAVIIVRKVTKREAQNISKQREADRPEWRKLLEEAGIRTVHKQEKKPPEMKARMISDLAFDALRLEFGYGGTKSIPHWRPGIQAGMHTVKRMWSKDGLFVKAMGDPKFMGWKKWPPKLESSIKIDTLKSFSKFSKRLRVRV